MLTSIQVLLSRQHPRAPLTNGSLDSFHSSMMPHFICKLHPFLLVDDKVCSRLPNEGTGCRHDDGAVAGAEPIRSTPPFGHSANLNRTSAGDE
jgi:hypothetical protein